MYFEDFLKVAVSFVLLFTFLFGVLVFCKDFFSSYSDEEIRIDVDGNKYVSSDLIEFDDDYYYKNADGDLVKIEFYEDDFKN